MSNAGECMIRMSKNEGSDKHLIEQICKKYVKGMNVSSIHVFSKKLSKEGFFFG